MEFDTSWCPVCEVQIVPKRYQVPVDEPQTSTSQQQLPSPSAIQRKKSARVAAAQKKAKGVCLRLKGLGYSV